MELLAPIGSKEALISAINNGADAVYLGGQAFSARAEASIFTDEDLVNIIKYCHNLGVKVYITVNTIIKETEFSEALKFVEFLYLNGVDAIIVQDLGLIMKVAKMFPQLVIHASTQVNVVSVKQALFLKSIGVRRIVLARELSCEEIKKIKDETGLEIEVFVHGALCMSYSGNCFLSSLVGKRSGNRGRCAQPCRKKYQLSGFPDWEYYLSMKDLMSLDYLDRLQEIGIDSLKIEGRLKKDAYVGIVVRSYYRALHQELQGNEKKALLTIFNRQFTKGFLNGETNSLLTNTASPNHQGIVCGKVVRITDKDVYIKLEETLNNNDSIRILGENPDAITINNNMYYQDKIVARGEKDMVVRIRTHHLVTNAATVLKTTDSVLISEIKDVLPKKIEITGKVYIENEHLVLWVSDGHNEVSAYSKETIEKAKTNNYIEKIIANIKKTGNTVFVFKDIKVDIENVFLPLGAINELRRQVLRALETKREAIFPLKVKAFVPDNLEVMKTKRMFVAVRTEKQLQDALSLGVKDIIVKDRKLLSKPNNLLYMPPRLCEDEGQVASNLNYLQKKELSSIYLNICNSHSVYLLHKKGVKTVGLSLELCKEDIRNLLQNYKKEYKNEANVCVMTYGYYEAMMMKHCLISKKLGYESKGCGYCDKHQMSLKDEYNNTYPLINDGNCHLIMLYHTPINLLNYLKELQEIGVSNILLDFTIEEDIKDIIKTYQECFYNGRCINSEKQNLGHFLEGVI